MAKRSGHAPVDQEGEAEADAGLGLFVDRGEVGLDRPFGHLESSGKSQSFLT